MNTFLPRFTNSFLCPSFGSCLLCDKVTLQQSAVKALFLINLTYVKALVHILTLIFKSYVRCFLLRHNNAPLNCFFLAENCSVTVEARIPRPFVHKKVLSLRSETLELKFERVLSSSDKNTRSYIIKQR